MGELVPFPVGLIEFLAEQPGLQLVLDNPTQLRISGAYALDAHHEAAGRITREYALDIQFPSRFPDNPPIVYEVGGQIPRTPDFHVNGDDTLCLGSPLAVRRALKRWPDVREFLARTLRPYLYAVTVKLESGRDFVFGELRHGTAGELQDLADDLQLSEDRVLAALDLLLMPATDADRRPCPCGCARELAQCELRNRLAEVRGLMSEASWRRLRSAIESITD